MHTDSGGRSQEMRGPLAALLGFSIRQRWLVVLTTVAIAALGIVNARRLPIDAVPDITNVQVQITEEAPPRRSHRRCPWPSASIVTP